MRKAWLTSTVAVLGIVGMTAQSVASPAGMVVSRQPALPSEAVAQFQQQKQNLPSSQVSPLRNPIKYLGAAFSELPFGSAFRSKPATRPTARTHNDAIALNTPSGSATPEMIISLGQMAERRGEIEQARKHFQQALAVWPGEVEVLRSAARMEDRQGNLPLAEMLYRQATESDPQHAGALNDLGLCLARQGKLAESAQHIEQAVHLHPDRALYRNNAATVLIELKEEQKALAHLAAVHGPAAANYNIGQLLVQRSRSSEAVPYFIAALENDPTMQAAQAALAKLDGVPVNQQPTEVAEQTITPSPTDSASMGLIVPTHGQYSSVVPVAPATQAPASGPTFGGYPSTGAPAPALGRNLPRHLPPVGSTPNGYNR